MVSIFEIKKIINKSKENDNNYSYEFIATSNTVYSSGKDQVVFYGIKNEKIEKIKIINNLSCSVEPNSICQLNDKIICIGLQNHNKENQNNGFALIDIYTRELHNIIKDYAISCLYCSKENKLLFASMEIKEKDIDYFSTNIYKIIENKDKKGNKEIELEKIYKYKNMTENIVISINKVQCSFKGVIFVTSSDSFNLEVVKAEIEI